MIFERKRLHALTGGSNYPCESTDEKHPFHPKHIGGIFYKVNQWQQRQGFQTIKDEQRRTAHPLSERPGLLQGRPRADQKSRYGEFNSPLSRMIATCSNAGTSLSLTANSYEQKTKSLSTQNRTTNSHEHIAGGSNPLAPTRGDTTVRTLCRGSLLLIIF
jgi:hypothetical protein